MLKTGAKIPSLNITLDGEKKIKLSELSGKKGFVLYFYPRDMTPGCTIEACDFRDNFSAIRKLGFNVVGVSKDDSKSHAKFTEKHKLNFTLIPDASGEICEKFGVWQKKKFMGREFMGIVRTTFLVDNDLKIRKVYDGVKVKGHVIEILNDIEELIK
ncbi:MAG: thioredoxin-dependent thiol peroxidase [Leptospira sp.]|nr:thioredoxin-dependent thiol peroxidase [Leptospira sp.]